MHVFLTGSEGFIGSHVAQKLLARGHNVRALVQYNSFNDIGWLAAGNCIEDQGLSILHGDVRDPEFIKAGMEGCDAVIHMAALIAIPYSFQAPRSFIDTNVIGTLNVLNAAKEHNVTRVLHTSTSEVYGTAQYVPIDESHPIVAQSPYAASKVAADQLATAFFASYEVPVVTVRPFNTYGPRQSQRAVIPSIIGQLALGKRKLELGSVHPTRDFSYVEDTAEAFVEILESNVGNGDVFNLGSGFEVSILETAQMISEIFDITTDIETDRRRLRPRKAEVERLYSDTHKVLDTFNWKPKYVGKNGFKEGLERTIEWYLSNVTKDERLLAGYTK